MQSKERTGVKQLQGVEGALTGTINNIVITSKGVIYLKKDKKKKR